MAVESTDASHARPRQIQTLQRKTSASRLPLASSTRVLRSSSREPAEIPANQNQSLKRGPDENHLSHAESSSKRPTHWPRGRTGAAEMITPAPARYVSPVPPSTLQRNRSYQTQSEQVLLAHDKTRQLTKQLETAHERITKLERDYSEWNDREFELERKVLHLERELREANLQVEDREARVSKLEQDRKFVNHQIEAQEEERRKAISLAELKVEKSEASTQAALEEVRKLKELNSSLEQRVRLSTHNEARAKQVSTDATTRIKLLEEDKARLQTETEQFRSQVAQQQADLEENQKETQRPSTPSSGDSAKTREILRSELIRQVDQFKALEQANSRMERELSQLKTHRANVELLKEENHQLKHRLTISDQLRHQLASTEVELEKLSQERSEWTIFIKQHEQEFTSPHDFFKSLASQRIENASLKARLGSRESEIKSRDRMISELETRLEEVEKERDLEFADKLKAQGQAKIAERNRDLDKRRIQMLNEQLKSYTDEERSFCDSTKFDDQKELQMKQLKDLLDGHREELSKVQQEAAELRQQLQKHQITGPSTDPNPLNLRSPEKGFALKTSLTEQIERTEALEVELDELRGTNEMLEMEMESLQLQVHRLERDLGRGEYNTSTTQVLCPEGSPVEVEQLIRSSMLESLRAENVALLKRISKLEKGIIIRPTPTTTKSTTEQQEETSSLESLVPRESLVSSRHQITRLEAEVSKQIKARDRLCSMYKETTANYKRALWEILGYSLEAVANGEYRLRSSLKDESAATMLFVPTNTTTTNTTNGLSTPHFEFKPNLNLPFHQSNLVVDLYQFWVVENHSLPCFTAALTLDLFKLKK